jgi:hypothetical protein
MPTRRACATSPAIRAPLSYAKMVAWPAFAGRAATKAASEVGSPQLRVAVDPTTVTAPMNPAAMGWDRLEIRTSCAVAVPKSAPLRGPVRPIAEKSWEWQTRTGTVADLNLLPTSEAEAEDERTIKT